MPSTFCIEIRWHNISQNMNGLSKFHCKWHNTDTITWVYVCFIAHEARMYIKMSVRVQRLFSIHNSSLLFVFWELTKRSTIIICVVISNWNWNTFIWSHLYFWCLNDEKQTFERMLTKIHFKNRRSLSYFHSGLTRAPLYPEWFKKYLSLEFLMVSVPIC